MKKIFLFFLPVVLFSALSVNAQDEKTQRIQASYILAFGQMPQAAEITHWMSQPQSASITQLMASHKAFITSGGYKKEAIINSYKDGWGLLIDADNPQYKYWANYNQTYTELMAAHIQYLTANPAEYEKVINRACKYVFNRNATSDEMTKWKSNSSKFSYLMIVGYLQNKKSKYSLQCTPEENAMSLGNASSAVIGAHLNVSITRELDAAGFISHNGSALVGNSGGTLIAAGVGKLITNDGGTLVAAGTANIALNSGAN